MVVFRLTAAVHVVVDEKPAAGARVIGSAADVLADADDTTELAALVRPLLSTNGSSAVLHFLTSATHIALATVMLNEGFSLLEALRLLHSCGGDAFTLPQAALCALLRLEMSERGAHGVSDLTKLDGAPKEWTYLRWQPDAASECVVARGHPIVARRLRPEPRMAYVSSLLSAEECAHIISITKEGGELHPSRVVNHEKGGDTGMRTHARTSESCRVSAVNDLVVRRAVQRAAYLAGLTPAHAEAVQVVHYDSGQEYRPHCDYFSPDDARYREKTLMQGNRLVSFFVYLSSCDAGGKTAFPQLGVGFAPEVGAAAMWYNIDRHGNLDERTLHAGEPVTHGEKWGMNIWLRERPRSGALRRSTYGPVTASLLLLPADDDGQDSDGDSVADRSPVGRLPDGTPLKLHVKLMVPPPKPAANLTACARCGDLSGPIGLCLCRERYSAPFLGTYDPKPHAGAPAGGARPAGAKTPAPTNTKSVAATRDRAPPIVVS